MYFPTSEGIELIIHISLNVFALIETGAHGCSELSQSADELVEVTACVIVRPECLTVVRVIATMETLLSAIIDNWNTLQKIQK